MPLPYTCTTVLVYTVPQLAKLAGCTPAAITQRIRMGRIVAYKPFGSSRWAIPASEVERLRQEASK